MEQEDVVEKYLKRRIAESREWFDSGPPDTIVGLKLRDFTCRAKPLEFLDDRQRREQYGVKFRLEWNTWECLIEIRMRPTRCLNKAGTIDSPYLITRVVNPKTKKAVDPGCGIPGIPDAHVERTSQLSIHEWWADRLDKNVLRIDKIVSKIQEFKRPASN